MQVMHPMAALLDEDGGHRTNALSAVQMCSGMAIHSCSSLTDTRCGVQQSNSRCILDAADSCAWLPLVEHGSEHRTTSGSGRAESSSHVPIASACHGIDACDCDGSGMHVYRLSSVEQHLNVMFLVGNVVDVPAPWCTTLVVLAIVNEA